MEMPTDEDVWDAVAPMLEVINPVDFIRKMGNGKTKPIVLECKRADGTFVETVSLLWQFSRFRRCCRRFAFPI